MRRWIPKIFSPSGQHIIEYLMLITLVCAGIIIMGPYVVRSWNSGVKTYEEGYVDSMNEPLLKGTLPALPCTCSGRVPGACGASGCAFNERAIGRQCIGSNGDRGCAPEVTCEPDPTCCYNLALPGCDINADSNCSCGMSTTPGADCYDPFIGAQNPSRQGCPPGERCFNVTCGTNSPTYRCRPPNPGLGEPQCPVCQNYVSNPLLWMLCVGDNLGLADSVRMRTVLASSGGGPGCSQPPSSAPKCEAECVSPFLPLDADGDASPGGAGAIGVGCGCPRGTRVQLTPPLTCCP